MRIKLIIVAMAILLVAAVVIVLKGISSPALVTKNPSEMALAIGDLSSGYKLDHEQFINGPEKAVEQYSPSSVTIWINWGFEASCYRTFKKSDETVRSRVDRYSSIAGAKDSYEYQYNASSQMLIPMAGTIGDQSFAIYLPVTDMTPRAYGVCFRKNNVFVTILVEGLLLADAVLYTRIVESKIS